MQGIDRVNMVMQEVSEATGLPLTTMQTGQPLKIELSQDIFIHVTINETETKCTVYTVLDDIKQIAVSNQLETESICQLLLRLNLFATPTYGGHIGLTESNVAVLSYTMFIDSFGKESFIQALKNCQTTVIDYREQLSKLPSQKPQENFTVNSTMLRV